MAPTFSNFQGGGGENKKNIDFIKITAHGQILVISASTQPVWVCVLVGV